MDITNWTRDLWYIADHLNLDGSGATTTALVAQLNTLPLAQRQHVRALAGALTAGVSNV